MQKRYEDNTLNESWEEFSRTTLAGIKLAPNALELIRSAFYSGAMTVWLMTDARSPAETTNKLREIRDAIQKDFLAEPEDRRRNIN